MRRAERVQFQKTFVDPLNPDMPITFVLRKMGKMEVIAALDHAAQLTADYVTGHGHPSEKGYVKPILLPPVDGQAVIPSEAAMQVGAFISRAQIVPDAERYTAEEIVSLMTSDTFNDAFSSLVEEIVPSEAEMEGQQSGPLAPAPSGEPSTPIASTEEPPATPALSRIP
jgi:hypothetical protein